MFLTAYANKLWGLQGKDVGAFKAVLLERYPYLQV